MNTVDLAPLRERWLIEGVESDMGLWWLADDVRKFVGGDTAEPEVMRLTLQALKPLLESGRLQAVRLFENGTYEPWQGSTESQLARIESEWRALGHSPQIGDVAWFIVPMKP